MAFLFATIAQASLTDSYTPPGTSLTIVPKFASLRSPKVNLRTGPSKQHPIEWTLTRQHLPVEVLGRYEFWREIRTHEGITGWVHKSMLEEKSWVMALTPLILHSQDHKNSPPLAKLQATVLGQLKKCVGPWCKIKVKGYQGWVPRRHLWGVPQSPSSSSLQK